MRNFIIFFCLFSVLLINQPVYSQTKSKSARHQTTDWRIEPSFKFDALCFLGVLTGDEFYVNYYKNEYAEFEPQLTTAARAALANLKRKIKDENKNIISAFLTLYFSAVDDRTLDDMLRTVKNSGRLKRNFRKTVYYSVNGWRLYESVRGDLRIVFSFLKDVRFESYWKQNILPKMERKKIEIEKDLPKYNVVSEVEKHLGFALPSNRITIYLLYYSRPHGIKITGTRFITDIGYPFAVVLRNAVHEMMHPPFDAARDAELKAALEILRADAFLMDKVTNHNPSFGYNSFEGFVEEDAVQAIEQIINEKFKVETEARKRWRTSDDGMHVFAVALYHLMKEENFANGRESFRDFLLRMIRFGKLKAGGIKPIYDASYDRRAG